ncbi:sensor histidine kinase [Pelorhabdus rhamnosifermentans]|uniref:sensor histidine kinase n=1 Tax=Pelorhabdus rhamnosifermentans TaxID=2772457 RepID=UPI001C060216|nr:sensor histidine kinase [Pelorhabdus rhamnosifermentans]
MEDYESIRKLCLEYTALLEDDICQLEALGKQLLTIATLNDTDIFIDAPLKEGCASIVLGWAHADNLSSLYKKSVVGEIAYVECEPAVYRAALFGEKSSNVRGVSQEGVPIAQTVVPIKNSKGKIIGVLIMEKDISARIEQEKQVEFLTQTADHLSQTLMSLARTGCGWDEWGVGGIFVLNPEGNITYANRQASVIAENLWQGRVMQKNLQEFLGYTSLSSLVEDLWGTKNMQYGTASYIFRAYSLISHGILSGCVVSVQDVTELREKERRIDMQSVIIEEINHRVKNTLQNVISLLYMQLRRTEEKEVKEEFLACINRILSIAKVYEVFTYQSRDVVNLNELALYIMEKIIESGTLPEQQVKNQVEGCDVFLHAKQAVPIALVLNEVLSNAVKHGLKNCVHRGEVNIKIREDRGTVKIRVENNGKQIKERDAKNQRKRLGLYLVKLLICEQMSGQFDLTHENGFVVANISFPLCGLAAKEEGKAI